MIRECPACHKLTKHTLVSKVLVDQSEIDKISGEPAGTSRFSSRVNVLLRQRNPSEAGKEEGQEGILTYKLTYKCEKCGATWEKFEKETVQPPQEYLNTEYRESP